MFCIITDMKAIEKYEANLYQIYDEDDNNNNIEPSFNKHNELENQLT